MRLQNKKKTWITSSITYAKKKAHILNLIPYCWYFLLLVIPMMMLFSLSFSEYDAGSPPYKPIFLHMKQAVMQIRLSFENYILVMEDAFYRMGYLHSTLIACIATILCLIIGYPMAYGMTRSRYKIVWFMLAMLPFLISFLLRIHAWITLLSPQGVINQFLIWCGFSPLSLMNNSYAVIVVIVYSYLPFMIFPLYAVLDKMDKQLLEAAYDLGCKPVSAFWRITVPLSRSGIFAGSSLVFIPALGEYLIPEFVGGPRSLTIGRLLWSEFFLNRDWPLAAAIAVTMIGVLFIPIYLFEKLQSGDQSL